MTTGNGNQTRYQVAWQVHDVTGQERRLIEKGIINAKDLSDWQFARLQLPYTSESNGHWFELEFWALGKGGADRSVGPALYSLGDSQTALEPAAGIGEILSERLTLALRLEYAR